MIFILKKFTVGATTNFFGEFIARKLFNHIENNEEENFKISVYISAIIAGGFYNLIAYRISSRLARVALIVGLTRSLIDVIDRMMGGSGLNQETYAEDFIYDTIIVYYIFLIITRILEMIQKKSEEKKFDQAIISGLPLSIAVNTYYNYRYREELTNPR